MHDNLNLNRMGRPTHRVYFFPFLSFAIIIYRNIHPHWLFKTLLLSHRYSEKDGLEFDNKIQEPPRGVSFEQETHNLQTRSGKFLPSP